MHTMTIHFHVINADEANENANKIKLSWKIAILFGRNPFERPMDFWPSCTEQWCIESTFLVERNFRIAFFVVGWATTAQWPRFIYAIWWIRIASSNVNNTKCYTKPSPKQRQRCNCVYVYVTQEAHLKWMIPNRCFHFVGLFFVLLLLCIDSIEIQNPLEHRLNEMFS